MIWFLIALLPPLLYAVTNHTDKYILSRYFHGGGVGSLIIFSGLFSILTLPIIYLIDPAALAVNFLSALILVASGSLTVVSILCYLYALEADDASVVIPFYQTIPVFTFILGFLLLGELLDVRQIFGSILVLVGAVILSFNLEGETWRFRGRVVALMLTASALYAINGVIFKFFALELGFWPSIFWDFVGKVLLGIFFLVGIKSYRAQFFDTIRRNRLAVFSLNSLSETLTIVADAVAGYATLLAPIALVSVVLSGFQPVFVFALGIILTLFLPRLAAESLGRRHLIQRLVAIVLIIAGTYFFS
jgi:uncharacterized membrane protein